MTRESIAERIIEIGILPVVRAASGAEAIAVGRRARRRAAFARSRSR